MQIYTKNKIQKNKMEKKLIEQLISNGLSKKKIKDIVDELEDDEPNQDLNKKQLLIHVDYD